jgi:hypothetical protein
MMLSSCRYKTLLREKGYKGYVDRYMRDSAWASILEYPCGRIRGSDFVPPACPRDLYGFALPAIRRVRGANEAKR